MNRRKTAFSEAAAELLAELESSRLEVVLVPQKQRTNEGGMIRVAASRNAAWYRRFCAAYPSGRIRRNNAPDTRIRRRETLRALESIVSGNERKSAYFFRLLPFINARAGSALEVAS